MVYATSGRVLVSHCVTQPRLSVTHTPVSSILWGFPVENRVAIEGEALNE